MSAVCSYLDKMESSVDLFNKWNIDCVFEIVFLSTRTDYGGKGIATKVAQHSINYAKYLNEKPSADDDLPTQIKSLRPKAVTAVFTGHFSQRVGEKLNFETIFKLPNTEFIYEGKTFAEKIEPIHTHSVYAALRLP